MSDALTREQVENICQLFRTVDYGTGHVNVILAHDATQRVTMARLEVEIQQLHKTIRRWEEHERSLRFQAEKELNAALARVRELTNVERR